MVIGEFASYLTSDTSFAGEMERRSGAFVFTSDSVRKCPTRMTFGSRLLTGYEAQTGVAVCWSKKVLCIRVARSTESKLDSRRI